MDTELTLRVESGPAKGQTLAVGPQGLTVGRQAGNDLAVEDTEASRQHARFDLRDGAIVLTDLGSANGTTLNGQPIAGEHRLAPGDVVGIGASTFRVAGAGADPALPAATVVGSAPPLAGVGAGQPITAPAGGQSRTILIIAIVGAIVVLCLCMAFALALIANAGGG